MSVSNSETAAIAEVLVGLLDSQDVIALRPSLARALGLPAAVFLSQAIYWQKIKGWGEPFWKDSEGRRDEMGELLKPGTVIGFDEAGREIKVPQSWEWETGLTWKEQKTARRALENRELLVVMRQKSTPPRNLYRVNHIKLCEFLLKNHKTDRKGDYITDERAGIKPPKGNHNSENTPETTPKISKTTTTSPENGGGGKYKKPEPQTPPTGQAAPVPPVGAELDDLVQAAEWAAGTTIQRRTAWRARVRGRLEKEGPRPEDYETLRAWRKHLDKQAQSVTAAVKAAEEAKNKQPVDPDVLERHLEVVRQFARKAGGNAIL